ncbi:protein downstream neighbor of son homolog [Cololabis saira]|uniref:protein downstream neighbor of son homolog n=1 Tax=Cololabis saira TaxID=129043 RepID=UPI002AD42E55|nr:protein downstream neighbor of son homolog [Cololabis saira]
MEQQTGYSPGFKRPAEILRLRRKRARSEAGVSCSSSPGQGSPSPASAPGESPGGAPGAPGVPRTRAAGTKRRNPFANIENTFSPQKKAFIYEDREGSSSVLDCSWTQNRNQNQDQNQDQEQERVSEAALLLQEEERGVQGPAVPTPPAPGVSDYPPDWSLKTRVLFTSPRSLSWTEQPKAQEEAAGLSSSCRARFCSLPLPLQDPRGCPELRVSFQQSLVYWQHPSVSWLSLFPRINAERSFSGKSAPWAADPVLQQSLMRDWSVSLSSLYSLLKARLCPYFYVCSYQFTVLFRAAGVGGSDSITALISPTTRGFREAMKNEGIEFSLPLVEEKKKSKQQPRTEEEEDDEGEEKDSSAADRPGDEASGDEDDDEQGSFLWLKELGVQVRQQDGAPRSEARALAVDHRPESVARVRGSSTFTLINFLINCRSLVAAAGSQAGLPPTLLAPGPFRGATLQTLKSRHINVKTQVGTSYQNISSLEISGPVLPSVLHSITELLRPAQGGNFSASLFTHQPTAVMNVTDEQQGPGTTVHLSGSGPVVDLSGSGSGPGPVVDLSGSGSGPGPVVDLSGSGLPPSSLQQLQVPPSLGKTALTHISLKENRVSWKS